MGWQEYEWLMPHGQCVRWSLKILLLEVPGNVWITLAYFVISWILFGVCRRYGREIAGSPFGPDGLRLLQATAAFIFLCGCTHAMLVVTVWKAWFPEAAFITAACAIVSVYAMVLYLRMRLRVHAIVTAFVASPVTREHFSKLKTELDRIAAMIDARGP